MSTPTDWVQFYSNSTALAPPGRATSSPDAAPSSSPPAAASTHGGGGHLMPEGRVAKPVRRRSRASRRTPTTLLNTDTSNFRAMVQQFTGGPTAPFAGGSQTHHGALPGFGFGQRVNPSTAVMVQPSMFYHHPPSQQQQHPPPPPQYQPQNYMFALNNASNSPLASGGGGGGGGDGGGGGGGDTFFQRLSSSRAQTMEVSNGYVMDVGSRQAAASSNENNRSNSYIF